MNISTIIFYVLALVILVSAAKAALSTNLVHSALFVVLTFLGVAGIYLLLYADFLAVVQVLVYVGAISVLLVFGVMLTRRGDISKSNLFNKYRLVAAITAGSLFVIVVWSVLATGWKQSAGIPQASTVEKIANIMFNEYVVPLEAVGILLLIAMIGAIVIGKGVNNSK